MVRDSTSFFGSTTMPYRTPPRSHSSPSAKAKENCGGDALQRLLLFTIAASMELRSNKIVEEEIDRLQMAVFRASFSKRSGVERDQRSHDLAAIATKYPEVNWSDGVVPPKVLAALFVRGVLDREAANAVLSEHPLIVGAAATPSWRRMWRWPG